MIYCIVSTAGYVETARIAAISWVTNFDDVLPAEAETPEEAVKSLADDLLQEYLEEWIGRATLLGTFSEEYFGEEFEAWLYDLVRLDSCNDGFQRMSFNGCRGPDHWTTYIPLEILRTMPKEEILVIPDNFEKIMAYNIDPSNLPDDEARKNHQEYLEDNYPTSYIKDEDGYHATDLDYSRNHG
jgi:hypothetical protein